MRTSYALLFLLAISLITCKKDEPVTIAIPDADPCNQDWSDYDCSTCDRIEIDFSLPSELNADHPYRNLEDLTFKDDQGELKTFALTRYESSTYEDDAGSNNWCGPCDLCAQTTLTYTEYVTYETSIGGVQWLNPDLGGFRMRYSGRDSDLGSYMVLQTGSFHFELYYSENLELTDGVEFLPTLTLNGLNYFDVYRVQSNQGEQLFFYEDFTIVGFNVFHQDGNLHLYAVTQ